MLTKSSAGCRSVFIIGIDGSGKTRHVLKLMNELARLGFRVKRVWLRGYGRVFFGAPFLLIARLIGLTSKVKTSSGLTISEYHFYNSSFVSRSWPLIELVDTLVFNLLTVHLVLLFNSLVLGDRSSVDTFVDAIIDTRKLTNASKYLRFFLKMLPKGSGIILLDVPPSVAKSRKDDIVDVEAIGLKRALYLVIARNLGWPIVNSSREFDETHNKVLSHVLNFLCIEKPQFRRGITGSYRI